MTLAYESHAEYKREKAKERDDNHDYCSFCNDDIRRVSWFTGEEGRRFCDRSCMEEFRKESPVGDKE